MIVTKENQRLYPSTWPYNAARIMTELARIVENNSGRVKYGNSAIISNRSINNAIWEKKERVKKLEMINAESEKETRTAAIAVLKKDVEQLENLCNDPITVTHTSYISFTLDDVYYYFSVDDNPFFPFHYVKTPVKNGSYSRDACMQEDEKEWLFDCFFSWNCSGSDIKEAANLILNMLCNAPISRVLLDSKKTRVPNRYDGGYHYETIHSKERFEKIDF